jgi:O-antigen/teichoic acid export membrane protein
MSQPATIPDSVISIEPPPPGKSPGSTSATVARNTLWFGAENTAALLTAGLVSILVARTFGPVKLGHFGYIGWVVSASGLIGSLGLPLTTRKYMAEYLGRGDGGTARAIFFASLRVQSFLAVCVASLGVLAAFTRFQPEYRLVSTILFAALIPQMIANVASQANDASERFASNVPGALSAMLVYLAGIGLTLILRWDLPGLALTMLMSRTAEMTVKLFITLKWIGRFPKTDLPSDLRKRMLGFARGSFVFTSLNYLVWERSDVLLLKLLQTDIRQIAFFSVPFSLVDAALRAPRTLSSALGASSLAHYGRNREGSFRITELSFKYMVLCGLPLLAGLAALSTPVMGLLYGPAYRPAANVLALISVMAVAKCVLGPVQNLYFATEKLGLVLRITCLCGVVNMLLDWILIPHYGALGAAIGSGVAQVLAAILLWRQAIRIFHLKLDRRWLSGVALSTLAMALIALPAALLLRHWMNIPTAIVLGACTFLLMIRANSVITADERERLLRLSSTIPVGGRLAAGLTNFLSPMEDQTPDSVEAIL